MCVPVYVCTCMCARVYGCPCVSVFVRMHLYCCSRIWLRQFLPSVIGQGYYYLEVSAIFLVGSRNQVFCAIFVLYETFWSSSDVYPLYNVVLCEKIVLCSRILVYGTLV